MSKDLVKEVINSDVVEESEQDVNAIIDNMTLFDDDLILILRFKEMQRAHM